ncbi:MAG: hypothetical protein ACKV2T_38960 [Kofleriaceae bacterium]
MHIALVLAPVVLFGACSSAVVTGDDGPPVSLPRTCLAPTSDRAGTLTLVDPLGTARVESEERDPDGCIRRYTISSTAALRDNMPANGERAVDEIAGAPTLRTGNDLFDALYALALSEARENSVDAIVDGAFSGGASIACPEGGCFETGRLWTYVWTRDVSYATDLGLAGIDPVRARNSLVFKLSATRTGGVEEIVQDTGTGGSWPVSSDRVTWALGAAAVLPHLSGDDRAAFAERAYGAIAATIERDRAVVFDADDGLYTGEQSFLDWREQTYPSWVTGDVAPIASSKALSTNVVHLRALEIAASLAPAADAVTRGRYTEWANALRERIRARFWIEDAGLYSTFVTTHLDPAPARQFDLLGNSLAITSGVATPAQATRILAAYPHVGPGAAPVIFPQQQLTRIYHNRAEWPFVTAYWLRAAAHGDNAAVATRAIGSLLRGAALNLSNMENLEIASGAAFVDDGAYSGPVVNSQRQLWSVGGYISMVHHTLFGLAFAGDELRVEPYVPRELRAKLFAKTDALVLNDVAWRGTTTSVVLHLPAAGPNQSDGRASFVVERVELNGRVVDGPIAFAELEPTNRIDITLADPADPIASSIEMRDASSWREIFAPRVPAITSASRAGDDIAIAVSAGGEDPSTIRYAIYRDGTRIADDVAGTSSSYTDVSADTDASPCFAVEACFVATGNCSQRSKPVCWWGDGSTRVTSIYPAQLQVTGGTIAGDHGRPHVAGWGDPGSSIVATVVAQKTGPHLVQLVYGNGAGPVDTGIACGIKRVRVENASTNAVVAEGAIVMPQLGGWDRWADSTFVRATLAAGTTYRITLDTTDSVRNMSGYSHFQTYAGTGGASGEFSRVNISELKLLAR